MAGPKIRRTVVALSTGTGNQNITISGFGTPKAAIITVSGAVTNGTVRAQAYFGFGATDGTNQVSCGMSSEDSVATSNNARVQKNTTILGIPDFGGATMRAEASFVQWITDGLQINVTTTSSSAYLLDVILIGGDGLENATVGQVSLGTGTAAINTSLGYDPSLVLPFGVGVNSNSLTTTGKMCVGAWDPGNSFQGCVAHAEADGTLTSESNGLVTSTYGYAELGSAALVYGCTFGAYSGGFAVTPSVSASSDVMGYLALKFREGTGVAASTETLPTATGSYSKTGMPFGPGFLLTLSAGVSTAVGTIDASDSESFTLTSVDRNGLCSSSYGVDDSADTMDTSSDQILTAEVEFSGVTGGTRRATSSFTSFNLDGWTKNLTATDAVAYKSLSIAIQANTLPAAIFGNHYRQQGMR